MASFPLLPLLPEKDSNPTLLIPIQQYVHMQCNAESGQQKADKLSDKTCAVVDRCQAAFFGH